jgi:ABC-2 type transport system permease protein
MDALRITLKDLRILARDTRAMVVLVVMPIIIIGIVGSSTGRMMSGDNQADSTVRIVVYDLDQSESSERLSGFLAATPNVVVAPADMPSGGQMTLEEATGSLDFVKDSDAKLVIGPTFESSFQDMPRSELMNPDSGPLREGLTAVDLHLTSSQAANPMLQGLLRLLLKDALQDAIMPILAEKVPVFRGAARDTVVPRPWVETRTQEEAHDDSDRVYRFVVPSYTVLFVFFLVCVMGRSFILERETGTLCRLRIAPIASASILVGKTLPFFVVSVLQTVLLLIAGRVMFSMSWGPSPLMLIPVVGATSLAATTMGLLFATVVKTESQVSAYGNLIVLSTAGISGCLVPRDWMPELTQQISLCTPHAWALDAYRELLATDIPDLTTVWMCCGTLSLFSAAFFLLGLWRFQTTS